MLFTLLISLYAILLAFLKDSPFDYVFSPKDNVDAVESRLFGGRRCSSISLTKDPLKLLQCKLINFAAAHIFKKSA